MATQARHDSALSLEEIDLSRAELWKEDRFTPLFTRLRAEDPVHFCPESEFGPYWSVTRHADIMQVEALAHIFSSSYTLGGITILGEGEPIWGDDLLPMFIAMDRPEHTGQRRAVAPAFTPSEMERLGASIRERTESPDRHASDRRAVRLGRPGLDRADDADARHPVRLSMGRPPSAHLLVRLGRRHRGGARCRARAEAGRHIVGMRRLFHPAVERARGAAAQPDLISRMIHSEATRSMTPEEYLGNLILLIVGGNDTTRNSMSALPIVNRRWPEEWAKIAADRTLLENATQELIRWQTPLAHMRRTALEDQEIGGKTIKAGEKVVIWYMSGNRDETVFPEAERFIADRENARRHLAFGFGIHRCVGARLAELQIATLLGALLDRGLMPVQTGDPERVNACFVHGYRKLPAQLVRA